MGIGALHIFEKKNHTFPPTFENISESVHKPCKIYIIRYMVALMIITIFLPPACKQAIIAFNGNGDTYYERNEGIYPD